MKSWPLVSLHSERGPSPLTPPNCRALKNGVSFDLVKHDANNIIPCYILCIVANPSQHWKVATIFQGCGMEICSHFSGLRQVRKNIHKDSCAARNETKWFHNKQTSYIMHYHTFNFMNAEKVIQFQGASVDLKSNLLRFLGHIVLHQIQACHTS